MGYRNIQQFEGFSAERQAMIISVSNSIRDFMQEDDPPERLVDALLEYGWVFDWSLWRDVSGERKLFRYTKNDPDGVMKLEFIFDEEEIDSSINLYPPFWARDITFPGLNYKGVYPRLTNPDTFYENMTTLLVEEVRRTLGTAKNTVKIMTKDGLERLIVGTRKGHYDHVPRIFRQLFGDTPENIGYEIFNDPRESFFSEYYGIPKGSSREEIAKKLRSRVIRKSMF